MSVMPGVSTAPGLWNKKNPQVSYTYWRLQLDIRRECDDMARVKRNAVGLILVYAFAAGAITACNQQAPNAIPAAPKTAIGLDGQPIDPLTATRSKVTVLLFTMRECPISNRYAPEIRRLYDKFNPKGVEFWMVYADPDDTAALIRAHMESYGHDCRAVLDPDHALVEFAGATRTPEAAVYVTADPSDSSFAGPRMVYRGRIDNWYVDFGKNRPKATTHDLDDAIVAALEGRPVANRITTAIGCYLTNLK